MATHAAANRTRARRSGGDSEGVHVARHARRGSRAWLMCRLVPCCAALALSCDSPSGTRAPPTPYIALAVDTIELSHRAERWLVAKLHDENGNIVPSELSWTSLDSTIARVNAGRYVIGVAQGITGVEARADDIAAVQPVRVHPAARFGDVAIVDRKVCAVDLSGVLYCWGVPLMTQLADPTDRTCANVDQARGSVDCWFTPTRVASDQKLATLAGGGRACGLDAAGKAFCWRDTGPRTGVGAAAGERVRTPRAVLGDHRFSRLAVGAAHTCALDHDGRVYCWGDSQQGQTGLGKLTEPLAQPNAVLGDLRFIDLAAGPAHTCGVTVAGDLLCWGNDAALPGGIHSPPSLAELAVLETPVRFRAVAAGFQDGHSCALTEADEMYCWGGFMGQPARQAIEGERFRLLVEGMPGCGLTHDNRVVCWYPFTTDATADFDLAFVKIVGTHSMWRPLWDPMVCGLGAHGETYCWGTNTHGQMGVGETIAQGRPTGVRPPPPPAR